MTDETWNNLTQYLVLWNYSVAITSLPAFRCKFIFGGIVVPYSELSDCSMFSNINSSYSIYLFIELLSSIKRNPFSMLKFTSLHSLFLFNIFVLPMSFRFKSVTNLCTCNTILLKNDNRTSFAPIFHKKLYLNWCKHVT